MQGIYASLVKSKLQGFIRQVKNLLFFQQDYDHITHSNSKSRFYSFPQCTIHRKSQDFTDLIDIVISEMITVHDDLYLLS
jgi:hypothetical protein